MKLKKATIFIGYNIVVVFLVLCLIEFGFTYLLNHPRSIPHNYFGHFKNYYKLVDKNIIQLQKEFAVYHPELFYTLKPGEFVFENREFSTPFLINSQGFRDDESSLDEAEIIVAGDSYAMGWGVDQDSSFAQILETISGKKVLNTAVSSYGTARELKTLAYANLDNVNTVIIQYCGNDIEENKRFYLEQNQLVISDKQTFNTAIEHASTINGYYPMKHFSVLASSIFLAKEYAAYKPIESFSEQSFDDDIELTESQLFLNVLLNSQELKSVPKIIVLELDYTTRSTFMEELRYTLQDSVYTDLRRKMVLMDFSEVINQNDYFLFDEHIKAKTHLRIAESMNEFLDNQFKSEYTAYLESKVDFENEAENEWNFNQNMVRNNEFHFDSKSEWGLSYRMNLKQTEELINIKAIELEYDFKGNLDSSGLMVLSIKQDTTSLFWQGIETMKSYSRETEDGSLKVVNRFTINEPLLLNAEESIELTVFYWNIKRGNFSLDNLLLRMRGAEIKTYSFQE